jgi:hypothetical protein
MEKIKLNSLVGRMMWNAQRLKASASGFNLSVGENRFVAEKLNSTADGIEIVVNAIKREISTD